MNRLFLCFVFLTFCLSVHGTINANLLEHQPSTPFNQVLSQNDIPNFLRPISRLIKRIFGKKPKESGAHFPPNVNDLTLSRTEINEICSEKDESGSESHQTIEISTLASDPENDALDHIFYVTGGKILNSQSDKHEYYRFVNAGESVTVVWDLSGLKPGIYTITAAVDDGCGFCGRTITKAVSVIECSKTFSQD